MHALPHIFDVQARQFSAWTYYHQCQLGPGHRGAHAALRQAAVRTPHDVGVLDSQGQNHKANIWNFAKTTAARKKEKTFFAMPEGMIMHQSWKDGKKMTHTASQIQIGWTEEKVRRMDESPLIDQRNQAPREELEWYRQDWNIKKKR